MPLLADIDFEAVAKIVVFAAIALAAIIQRVRKERGQPQPPRRESPHPPSEEQAPPRRRHDPSPSRRPDLRPSAHPRTAPEAEAAPSHRAPGTLGGLPAPSAAEPRAHLADLSASRFQSMVHPTATPAAMARRTTELTGLALLFGQDLTPRDRVRSALLWREVLELPPSLSDPR